MSIDRCSKCSALVDTDAEPEAYVEIGNMRGMDETICLCFSCRDKREAEQDEADNHPTDEELEAIGGGGLK